MDTSVGVAVCVHLVVGIAVQVALAPVKCSGHKDIMAYMCVMCRVSQPAVVDTEKWTHRQQFHMAFGF